MNAVATPAQPRTLLEERVISLMSRGYAQSVVAASLGVTESRVSQILADEGVAAEIAENRFTALNKYNEIDAAYDEIEDKLQQKLKKSLPLMVKPMEIVKAMQVINGAKRRGHSAETGEGSAGSEIVKLDIPKSFRGRLQVVIDSDNRVINAGGQALHTATMGSLPTEKQAPKSTKELSHDTPTVTEVEARTVGDSTPAGYSGSSIRASDL